MRNYSAAAIGILVVGLLSACGDPNAEITVECSVFLDGQGELVSSQKGIPTPRQVKTLQKDQNGVCQQSRNLADSNQLRFCSTNSSLPCVVPDAKQLAAAKPTPVTEPFSEPPVVEGVVVANDSLIDPIDKKSRLEQIKQDASKKDPFQELDAKIPPPPPPPKVQQSSKPTPPKPNPRGPITIKDPVITQAPPPPDPAEAKAVKVSGILQIGQEIVAIAAIPGDRLPTRTIRVGQRIAEGKVLVKRIDTSGLTPTVVLEQFGIEVKRSVGEVVAAADSAAPGQLPAQPTQ